MFHHFDDVVLTLPIFFNIVLLQLLIYLLLYFLLLLLYSISLLTPDKDSLSKALVFNCSLCVVV